MRRRAFLATTLCAAVSGCGFGLMRGFRPFTFIQMADPQIGFLDGGERGDHFAAETKMLETGGGRGIAGAAVRRVGDNHGPIS